jgi:hypothetical protein
MLGHGLGAAGLCWPLRTDSPTWHDIDKIAAIVNATLQTKPEGMTHWSCRTMAKAQGVSKSTVDNIWQAHQLKPHRVKTFKLSRDPKFLEKMTDVIGLYLNPPQQAMVLRMWIGRPGYVRPYSLRDAAVYGAY